MERTQRLTSRNYKEFKVSAQVWPVSEDQKSIQSLTRHFSVVKQRDLRFISHRKGKACNTMRVHQANDNIKLAVRGSHCNAISSKPEEYMVKKEQIGRHR